jgi:hypothetical protein
VRSYSFKEVQPSAEDEVWIKAKLQLLDGKQSGSVGKTGPAGDAAQKWFKQFLKRSGGKAAKPQDFSEVEKKQKITLPQDYKKFIAAFGLKTFADVCGLEGTSTRVLLPRKLDFKNYRRGKVPYLEGEQAQVDGVVFAEIDNGDCFVFDVSAEGKEYPVYWHKHEENDLEAFAANFAECIKRFSEKS